MPAQSTPAEGARPAMPTPGWQILALSLLLGLQPVSTDLYLPALPLLRAELSAGMTGAQLTLSALMVCFGLGQLLLGPVSDRFGRRPVLLAGLSLYVIAALGAAAAQSMNLLVACRALQGLGLAASVVGARSMVRDWFEPTEGTKMMARGLGGLGVLAMLSPTLGGVLASALGWRAALLATAVIGAGTLAMLVLRVPESLQHKDPSALQPRRMVANWASLLAHPTFRAYTLLTCLAYGTLYTFLASSSFVFIGVLGVDRMVYGLLVSGGSVLYLSGTMLCRRWLQRHTVAQTVKRGAVFSLIGAVGMGLAAFVLPPSLPAILIPHVFVMLGHGVLQPCSQAGSVGPFPRQAGAAAALSGFAVALIAFVLGGWLGHSLDGTVRPMTATMMALGLGAVLCSWTLVQSQDRRARQLQAA